MLIVLCLRSKPFCTWNGSQELRSWFSAKQMLL
jgi:hypothetical protein